MTLRSFILSSLLIFSLSLTSSDLFAAEAESISAPQQDNTSTEVQVNNQTQIALPEPSDFKLAFSEGVKFYQDKKFLEAEKMFEAAARFEPMHSGTLTNLGLTAFELGKKGLALGYLRRARELDPDFSAPKSAIAYIEKALETKEIPHEIRFSESLKDFFIKPISLNSYLAFLALCTFAAGWLWLDFIGEVKNLKASRSRLSEFPALKVLVTVFFLLAALGTGFKYYFQQKGVATVVAKKIPVFSAPKEDAVQLFDLYEGLEIQIESKLNDWIQVTYPGTPTGWIREKDIYQTSLKN